MNYQRCGTTDIRLKQAANAHHQAVAHPIAKSAAPTRAVSHIPSLPALRTHPDAIHPENHCTLYVVNIAYSACERDIIEYFNSIGGVFENRCTALAAVNLPYITEHNGQQSYKGQGFFMYSTPELANYALYSLNRRTFRGRPLQVEMSKRKLDCRHSQGGNIRGQSRWGENIFDFPPPL